MQYRASSLSGVMIPLFTDYPFVISARLNQANVDLYWPFRVDETRSSALSGLVRPARGLATSCS